MTIAELKKLIASMPDTAKVMVIDHEDSCAHLVADKSFVHSDGSLMLQMFGTNRLHIPGY